MVCMATLWGRPACMGGLPGQALLALWGRWLSERVLWRTRGGVTSYGGVPHLARELVTIGQGTISESPPVAMDGDNSDDDIQSPT